MYSDVVEFRASKTVAHDAVLVVMRALMSVMRHGLETRERHSRLFYHQNQRPKRDASMLVMLVCGTAVIDMLETAIISSVSGVQVTTQQS